MYIILRIFGEKLTQSMTLKNKENESSCFFFNLKQENQRNSRNISQLTGNRCITQAFPFRVFSVLI